MDAIEVGLTIAGVLIATYGLLAALAALFFPWLLQTSLFAPKMFLGRIEPTRSNQTLLGLWYFGLGAFFALSAAELRPWNYLAGVATLMLLVPVIALHVDSRRSEP